MVVHTTAFVTPVVEHRLEQDDPSRHEQTFLPLSYQPKHYFPNQNAWMNCNLSSGLHSTNVEIRRDCTARHWYRVGYLTPQTLAWKKGPLPCDTFVPSMSPFFSWPIWFSASARLRGPNPYPGHDVSHRVRQDNTICRPGREVLLQWATDFTYTGEHVSQILTHTRHFAVCGPIKPMAVQLKRSPSKWKINLALTCSSN